MRPTQRITGFTLIELLIVVVVIAILAAIALPAYTQFVIRAERAEGINAVLDVLSQQERYRANNTTYATNALLTASRDANPEGLGLSGTSDEGRWAIAIGTNPAPTATRYTVTATKAAGRTDTLCSPLVIEVNSGQASVANADQANCWRR